MKQEQTSTAKKAEIYRLSINNAIGKARFKNFQFCRPIDHSRLQMNTFFYLLNLTSIFCTCEQIKMHYFTVGLSFHLCGFNLKFAIADGRRQKYLWGWITEVSTESGHIPLG